MLILAFILLAHIQKYSRISVFLDFYKSFLGITILLLSRSITHTGIPSVRML